MLSRVKLFDMDEAEVQEGLAAGAPAYLLVNPIEYHGPHLSLLNDSLVSQGIARDMHTHLSQRASLPRPWPLLVTRDLDVGCEPAPGPGSEPRSFGTVKARILIACRELVRLGARRVVFVTFHGSPLHAFAIEAGVRWLSERGVQAFSPMNLLLAELLSPEAARYEDAYSCILDQELRRSMLADVGADFHGGFFETSVALHYAPSSVHADYTKVLPCPPFAARPLAVRLRKALSRVGLGALGRELEVVSLSLSWFGLRPFPGYTGRPALARAEAGEAFARHLMALFVPAAERIFSGTERPGAPPFAWLPLATLWGKLGARVPASALPGPLPLSDPSSDQPSAPGELRAPAA